MEMFANISDARLGIVRYLINHASGELHDQLLDLTVTPSPVDQIVKSCEALYARKADLDEEGRTLAGQLAMFAADNYWHGMGDGAGRGRLIAQAMMRDNGEKRPTGGKWPSADNDPAPLDLYQAQA